MTNCNKRKKRYKPHNNRYSPIKNKTIHVSQDTCQHVLMPITLFANIVDALN